MRYTLGLKMEYIATIAHAIAIMTACALLTTGIKLRAHHAPETDETKYDPDDLDYRKFNERESAAGNVITNVHVAHTSDDIEINTLEVINKLRLPQQTDSNALNKPLLNNALKQKIMHLMKPCTIRYDTYSPGKIPRTPKTAYNNDRSHYDKKGEKEALKNKAITADNNTADDKTRETEPRARKERTGCKSRCQILTEIPGR